MNRLTERPDAGLLSAFDFVLDHFPVTVERIEQEAVARYKAELREAVERLTTHSPSGPEYEWSCDDGTDTSGYDRDCGDHEAHYGPGLVALYGVRALLSTPEP